VNYADSTHVPTNLRNKIEKAARSARTAMSCVKRRVRAIASFSGSSLSFLNGLCFFVPFRFSCFFERFPGFISGSLPAVAQPAIRARPLPLEAVGAM